MHIVIIIIIIIIQQLFILLKLYGCDMILSLLYGLAQVKPIVKHEWMP